MIHIEGLQKVIAGVTALDIPQLDVGTGEIAAVVGGKALASMLYLILDTVFVFAVNWTGVVQWQVAVLFLIGTGLLSSAVGLFLGIFLERQ